MYIDIIIIETAINRRATKVYILKRLCLCNGGFELGSYSSRRNAQAKLGLFELYDSDIRHSFSPIAA